MMGAVARKFRTPTKQNAKSKAKEDQGGSASATPNAPAGKQSGNKVGAPATTTGTSNAGTRTAQSGTSSTLNADTISKTCKLVMNVPASGVGGQNSAGDTAHVSSENRTTFLVKPATPSKPLAGNNLLTPTKPATSSKPLACSSVAALPLAALAASYAAPDELSRISSAPFEAECTLMCHVENRENEAPIDSHASTLH